MRISELIDRLLKVEVRVGNIRESVFYKNNSNNDVRIGLYARISKRDKRAIDNQLMGLKFFVENDLKLKDSHYFLDVLLLIKNIK